MGGGTGWHRRAARPARTCPLRPARLDAVGGQLGEPLDDGEQVALALVDGSLLGRAPAAAADPLDLRQLVRGAEPPRVRGRALDELEHRLARRPFLVALEVD